MTVKKMAAKKAAKKPKPRKTKRNTLDGRYGDGEKAAEKLARRICDLLGEGLADAPLDWPALRDRIKAELLAAVVVEESAGAEVLWKGWAITLPSRKPALTQWGRVPFLYVHKRDVLKHASETVEAVVLVRRKAGRA